MSQHLGLTRLAAWEEGYVTYYLYASPTGPAGRVVVLTALGPHNEHRWVILPQGKASGDLARWTDADERERTRLAEELLRRGRSA